MVIGQRMCAGPVAVWARVAPALVGIGIAQQLISFLISLYYNVVMAWSFFYFFNSFSSPLPWSQCDYVDGLTVTNTTNLTEICRNDTTRQVACLDGWMAC
eukprot:m.120496 g.120496  ORF g.120496 m.120496 type:complete len:100 (+) comp37733_c0_seq7:313-612(+)